MESLTHDLELLSGGYVHATSTPSDKASVLCVLSQAWEEHDTLPQPHAGKGIAAG